MPPVQKKPTPEASEGFLKIGDLINIVNNGRTYQNYEVLGVDDNYLKVRADMSVAPQTEVVLFPHAQIEAIGLVNER